MEAMSITCHFLVTITKDLYIIDYIGLFFTTKVAIKPSCSRGLNCDTLKVEDISWWVQGKIDCMGQCWFTFWHPQPTLCCVDRKKEFHRICFRTSDFSSINFKMKTPVNNCVPDSVTPDSNCVSGDVGLLAQGMWSKLASWSFAETELMLKIVH